MSEVRWKVGVEAPPFMAANTSIMQLLLGIHDGTVDAIPSIVVSEAVAIQIYRLVFDKLAQSKVLRAASIAARGLYVIIASLVFGTRTVPPRYRPARML